MTPSDDPTTNDLGATIGELETLIEHTRDELHAVLDGRRPPPGVVPPVLSERVDHVDPSIFSNPNRGRDVRQARMRDESAQTHPNATVPAATAPTMRVVPPDTTIQENAPMTAQSIPLARTTESPIAKTYEPHAIEKMRYRAWEDAG